MRIANLVENGKTDIVNLVGKVGKFIFASKSKAIEVKSSGYKSHKSLDEFCTKFSDRIMNRYVIYTKDYKRENGVDYIPVYMTMFL